MIQMAARTIYLAEDIHHDVLVGHLDIARYPFDPDAKIEYPFFQSAAITLTVDLTKLTMSSLQSSAGLATY